MQAKLNLTPTKNMLPRSSLSKSQLMPLSVDGSHLVGLGFFGFVSLFPNNELIVLIRLLIIMYSCLAIYLDVRDVHGRGVLFSMSSLISPQKVKLWLTLGFFAT